MPSLVDLNPEQRRAVETIEGPVLILAGAGSGKTRAITYRMAHMVEDRGIPAQSILAVTFTNKAAGEMRERLKGLIGSRISRKVTVGTFHALGLRILREKSGKASFTLYDTNDQISIIREGLRTLKNSGTFERKGVLARISQLKNLGIRAQDYGNSSLYHPDDAFDQAMEYLYNYYEEKLSFYGAIDFDDILIKALELLKAQPEIAQFYSERFRYIMVDEFQDTNPVQFEMLRCLTSTHKNLCVVGDDDQSIYGFRGAKIENILSFDSHFPGTQIIKLEENYRSTRPIINLANEVIKQSPKRREKTMRSPLESPHLPLLWMCGSTEHEAETIIDDILKEQTRGRPLADIAILVRSNNQFAALEDALGPSQIPYALLGGQKFYDKKEVKDILAYLAALANPRDEISLRRILNVPSRGISAGKLKKLLEYKEAHKITLRESLTAFARANPEERNVQALFDFECLMEEMRGHFETLPLHEAIEKLLVATKYRTYIDASYDNALQAQRRKEDLERLMKSAERYSNFHLRMHENLNSMVLLRSFIDRLLLQDSSQKEKEALQEDEDVRPNQVTLMTLHSSKGLEFEVCYLVGVEEEILPHKRVIKENTDLGEELRLTYVGITRAKEKLVMTYCKERKLFGKNCPRYKSRFLLSPKDLYVEQDRTQFGHLTEVEAKEFKKNFFDNLISNL